MVGTAGAALGGLIGNQIGHGGGRAAADRRRRRRHRRQAIERKIEEQDGQEIVIRLDNGASVAIVQLAPARNRGRVRVLTGPKGLAEPG